MQSTSGCCAENSWERLNQFALVSYIPDPLGKFLDALRLHLVPDCKPRAHVTILPPRPLCGGVDAAIEEIQKHAIAFHPFHIRLGEVAKFEQSDVIYLEIASGDPELKAMYQTMNSGPSFFCEKYSYSPHITLAQNLPPERVEGVFDDAKLAWNAYRQTRAFDVDHLCFVQNTAEGRWIDLMEAALAPEHPAGRATRKGRVVPLRRASR